MFLAGVIFIKYEPRTERLSDIVDDKLIEIQTIIRNYATADPTYLNEFLYWITGKKTLPHDGFTEFGRQLQVRFLPKGRQDEGVVGSHTCSAFVYTELSEDLLVDDLPGSINPQTSNQKLQLALSKEMIVVYSGGGYNQAGGYNNILQLKNFI